MICPNCGEDNKPKSRFCSRCGKTMPGSGAGPFVKMVIAVAVLMLGMFIISQLVMRKRTQPVATATPSISNATPTARTPDVGRTTLTIAYGSEKELWMRWAAAEFAKTDAGQSINLVLESMGSLDAAQAIVRREKPINVWAPASSLYKNVFLRDFEARNPGARPIVREEKLALSPLVMVMWSERADAFQSALGPPNFKSVADAVTGSGWDGIANKPEWGPFKFSHTDPGKSNSGITTLLLMAYDFHGKSRDLTPADVSAPAFQQWLRSVESLLQDASSGLETSTGYLMTKMIQRGPSTYDVVTVYESNAIERLEQAQGRWGNLRVVYPPRNFWNDNPYYVLGDACSTPQQQQAARAFLDFLLSDRAQREALVHGFRPANLKVPVNTPDSPLVKYAGVGLRVDFPGVVCDAPRAETIEAILLAWQRARQ